EAQSVKRFRVGRRESDLFIVGKSEIMQRISDLIEKVASSKASTVLIQGESGTGKGLIARAIHKKSNSRERPFIEITCSSLPETLLESELFGYEKGAFTDAKSSKIGLVELAQGGTLFLDEIGELPLNLQAKLLRLIETKCFRRIGGVRDIEVDTRVIAATNCDLKSAMEHGKFREDLYFRLMVIPIYVPPLRERKEDIPILARHFIDYFNEELKKYVRGVSKQAMQAMLQYDWPGNVRELRNTIERAILLESTDLILPEHLPKEITESLESEVSFSDRISSLLGSEPITLLEAETIAIKNALKWTGGNKTKAAKLLGISRQTLRNKIRALRLEKN
ncbi:MAG: sigma-54 interaction domain-containing protein, partial [bacterium]